jgi:transposase
LLLDAGKTFSEISSFLFLDDDTLRSTYCIFEKDGTEGLYQYNYSPGLSYLSSKEIKRLDKHLQTKLYSTSKEIVNYIELKYGVKYTAEGVRNLLHRQNFVFKKTKHIPGKGDLLEQKKFVRKYRKIKRSISNDDSIYFMDGVHPMHNSTTANAWIKKGTEKGIKANTGRKRLNINGLCNVDKLDVIIHEDTSVNAQSTIALFDKAQAHQPKGLLIIIADNARYYRSKMVEEYVRNNERIIMEHLPSYSPNLNLIERLWKFYKKEVCGNKYYEKFAEFKKKSLSFFENIRNYKKELKTLLVDNFYFPIEKFSNT